MAERNEILMKLGESRLDSENKAMNMEEPETTWPAAEWTAAEWTAAEASVLMLVREREWAEAYAADRPRCRMGRVYLDFICRELATAQAEL